MNPQIHGNPRRRFVATAIVAPSTIQGRNAKRTTTKDSLRIAEGSRPRPARIKMTTRARDLKSIKSRCKFSYSVIG